MDLLRRARSLSIYTFSPSEDICELLDYQKALCFELHKESGFDARTNLELKE